MNINPEKLIKLVLTYRHKVRTSWNPMDLILDRRMFYSDCQEYTWLNGSLLDEYNCGLLGSTGIIHDMVFYTRREPIKSKLGLNCYKYYEGLGKFIMKELDISEEEFQEAWKQGEENIIKRKLLQELKK